MLREAGPEVLAAPVLLRVQGTHLAGDLQQQQPNCKVEPNVKPFHLAAFDFAASKVTHIESCRSCCHTSPCKRPKKCLPSPLQMQPSTMDVQCLQAEHKHLLAQVALPDRAGFLRRSPPGVPAQKLQPT